MSSPLWWRRGRRGRLPIFPSLVAVDLLGLEVNLGSTGIHALLGLSAASHVKALPLLGRCSWRWNVSSLESWHRLHWWALFSETRTRSLSSNDTGDKAETQTTGTGDTDKSRHATHRLQPSTKVIVATPRFLHLHKP